MLIYGLSKENREMLYQSHIDLPPASNTRYNGAATEPVCRPQLFASCGPLPML